jgi:hypothetical protein
MRVAVPLALGERRPARLVRALTVAVPALLAALVVTGTLLDGRSVVVDARLAGVAVAALVTAVRGPLGLAVLLAVATTAGVRAL